MILDHLNAKIEKEIDDKKPNHGGDKVKLYLSIRFFPSLEDLNSDVPKIAMEDLYSGTKDFSDLLINMTQFFRCDDTKDFTMAMIFHRQKYNRANNKITVRKL
jgi:hypothetical protein